MVPLESTAKALGFTGEWDGNTTVVDSGKMHSSITISKDQYQAVTSIEGALGATAPFPLGNNDSALTLEDGILYYHTAETEWEASTETGSAQLPNSFVDCDTAKEAADVSGVTLTVENPITGYHFTGYRASKTGLIEVIYANQLTEDDMLRIRKAPGEDDISGDYNEYKNVKNVAVNGKTVTMKGNGESVYLATWQKDGNSYAVSSEKGLTRAKMSNIIRNVD